MTNYGVTTSSDGRAVIASRLFPKGDFVVIHTYSPTGYCVESVGVWCMDHQQMMCVNIDFIRDTSEAMDEKILKAASECPKCVAEKKPLPESKWPEGAEL